MARKRTKTIAGVASALGLTAAYLVLRDFIAFVRRGGAGRMQEDYARRRMVQARIPAQQAIPVSGVEAPMPVGTAAGPSPVLEELVPGLLQYLVNFYSMVELARSRKEEGLPAVAGSALQPVDRDNFNLTLERLGEQYQAYGPANMKGDSLPVRVYTLMQRLHKTMTDPTMRDDELFRAYDDVSNQVCRLMDDIEAAGAGTGVDYRYTRTLYNCN